MKLDILFHYEVDENTGEITYIGKEEITVNTSKTVKSTSNKTLDTEEVPKLTLDSTKCYFNLAAVSLMEISPDDRIDIKYENGTPIIGKDEVFGTKGGNRVSKNNTFACRGNKNSELSKHGNEFIIIPHPNRPKLFILDSENKPNKLTGDENVNIDGDIFNLDDLIDDKNANITEIDSTFFKL